MLRQQPLTEEETATQAFVHAPEETTQATAEAPKLGWRTLYETYIADNPVFWKETNRPDLSAFTPKMRTQILNKRDKIALNPKKIKDKTLSIFFCSILFFLISSMIFHFIKYSHMPPFIFFFSPFIIPIGLGSQIARNICLEREKRTWDSLILTRLTPAQILAGKLLPVLRPLFMGNLAMPLLLAPAFWTGRVPAIALLAAIPLLLTMNLPGALLALRAGLFGKSPDKASTRALLLQFGPLLLNLLAGIAGAVGVLFIARFFGWLLLVPWLVAAVNVLWARALWLRLLRDFHKAPRDFSG